MGFMAGLWLVLLGVLGASNLIIAQKPDAKELIDKLAPYQGWIGVVSAFWGLWTVISFFLNVDFLNSIPVFWLTYLATGAVQLALGFLLGVGIMKTFIKDETAQEKMDEMNEKLAPKQGTLGLVGIGLGIWCIISSFIWSA